MDRHEVGARLNDHASLRRKRQQTRTRLAPLREHLLRADLPAPCHLGRPGARRKALSNHLRLALCRPAPPTARSGQNLHPAIPSPRVIVKVKNSVNSKLSASSRPTTLNTSQEEWPRRNGDERPDVVSVCENGALSLGPCLGRATIESCFARAVNTKVHHNTSSRRSRRRLCNRLSKTGHMGLRRQAYIHTTLGSDRDEPATPVRA